MTKSLTNTITLVLACAGLLLTILLTIEHYAPDSNLLPCSKGGGGCSSTLKSAYAQVGPIPTSLLGFGMYAVFAGLCLKRHKQLITDRDAETRRAAAYAGDVSNPSDTASGSATSTDAPFSVSVSAPVGSRAAIRQLDMAVWGLALVAFVISVWLQYVSIFGLRSFCPYCFTSATLVTIIFAIASRDYLLDGRALNGEQKLLGGVLAFIGVLIGFMVIPQIQEMLRQPLISVQPTFAPELQSVVETKDMHIKGDPKARLLLIEFGDYQCPHCKVVALEMEKAIAQHKELRIAFRNYPLPNHQWAKQAAAAAEAAALQGKFWEMHDAIYAQQEKFELPSFKASDFSDMAKQIGLDVPKFETDMESKKVVDRVASDMDAGETVHIQSTPTLFMVSPTNPNKVTRFGTNAVLTKALADPNDPIWK